MGEEKNMPSTNETATVKFIELNTPIKYCTCRNNLTGVNK